MFESKSVSEYLFELDVPVTCIELWMCLTVRLEVERLR